MSPLDYAPDAPDPSSVSPWPTAVRYGLIGGIFLVCYFLLGNITGFGRPRSGVLIWTVYSLLYFVIYIGILVFAIKNHKGEDLGGFIDIKRSVLLGTGVALIAGIISSVFGYIYMTMIEPDMAANIVEEMIEMFENMEIPEETYEAELEDIETRFEPNRALIQGILGAPVIGAIFSLIIGAIMKKDRLQ